MVKVLIYEYEQTVHEGTDDIKDVWYFKDVPANWCHTLQENIFMPSFSDHPEYYALIDGERSKLQPCLSNPDLLQYVSNLVGSIDTDKIIDISIGDNNAWCQCETCRSKPPSQALVEFLNVIAASYPDKQFSTLAYYQTQSASIAPASNIMVMISTITVTKDEPIEFGTRGEAIEFRRDLAAWRALGSEMLVWDYTCMFLHLLMPFPATRNIARNIKWYAKQGVRNFIVQNNSWLGHEFSELKSDLIVAMMTRPTRNICCTLNLLGRRHYGRAWSYVKKYIDLLHAEQKKNRKWVTNWSGVEEFKDGYLSNESITKYLTLINMAISANNCIKTRAIKLQPYYALIELGRATKYEIDQFRSICQELGNVTVNQFHLSWEQYLIDTQ